MSVFVLWPMAKTVWTQKNTGLIRIQAIRHYVGISEKKNILKKVNFEKSNSDKKPTELPSVQRVNNYFT